MVAAGINFDFLINMGVSLILPRGDVRRLVAPSVLAAETNFDFLINMGVSLTLPRARARTFKPEGHTQLRLLVI